ncbi:Oxidoreductase molybdopterin binding domain-containing protein [Streptomyces zhaozhouensis]|uniref:Oxidoreductase molybdopterin binding domain-containing protein n=1 Tax=Streptomyces zhaozhouensis TaxID=1300267 RepID=A0A286DSD6_9ACTN|nr:molybdopterin-dependent oxidoreductase [Streptomyces zhaozhouensis]SOD61586.1 Oxidoreductase molybdopterin binding domain-containing protein [Streptomyces zhaozhouensis]
MPEESTTRERARLHDARTATAVGRWLGAGVVVCFVTGLVSHHLQTPPGWLAPHLPTRPVWGYQFTQGLHVATGIALVPLLLVKLWAVRPKLFVWPPVRSVRHAAERASVGVLVSAALLEVFLGLVNTAQWYPWPFPFRAVHWALAWVLVGATLLHVALKAPEIAANWRRVPADPQGPDRRSLLRGTGAAVGVVTLATAGQSFAPLRPLTLLAPRRPDASAQGVPVNRTAAEAGVAGLVAAEWRLEVAGPRPFSLTLAELRELPQHTARLPIACVEGWSASADWTGVRVRDLLARVDAPEGAAVRVESLQSRGGYRTSVLPPPHAWDPLTLLALRINGEELSPDHGFPARIIAPHRPGVLQTKWIGRIEVLS